MTTALPSTQDLSSILAQVKGLEEEKNRLLRLLEEEKSRATEAQAKADRMSEGKRNEMRAALEGVIMKWLQDSVQDEKLREEFKQGMTRLVDTTAEDSGVWQVVCCASNRHARDLEQLEQIRIENDALKARAGGEFHDEGSRKRQREDEPAGQGNIWTEFAAEIGSRHTLVPAI
jgi:hypothetical protein